MRLPAILLFIFFFSATEAGAQNYLQAARVAQDSHAYPAAKAYAQKAIAVFTGSNQYDSLGEAYVMLWSASSLDGMPYAERTAILEKAAAAFNKAGNRHREGDCFKEDGDDYQLAGNFPAALAVLKTALQLYQAAGWTYLQSVYDLLGVVSAHMGDYREGVRYGLLAISTASAMGDTTLSLCPFYNHVATAYYDLHDWRHALGYFDISLNSAIKYNDEDGILTLAYNLVNLYIAWTKPKQALSFFTGMRDKYPAIFAHGELQTAAAMISIYDALRLYEKGEPYCQTLEDGLKRKDLSVDFRASYYLTLIRHYSRAAEYGKAEATMTAYQRFCHTLGVARYNSQVLLWRFYLDSAAGRYVTAIGEYQQYKRLVDTILNENNSRQIEQYNVLYETEKKDKSIQLLKKQAEIQLSTLRQEHVLRNITVGGISLLVLVLGLLYYAYRVKQRSNHLLKAQGELIDRKNQSLQRLVTEKDWLVKEIHHRVKNNLHMVVGLLASQAEYIRGREAFEAITDSQHRVQAMSLIHQKLYQTENLSSIDMPVYVYELVDYLESSFDKNTDIRFDKNIVKAAFPLSHSIPIGLILNEAITNSIKYAFPRGRKGRIGIALEQTGNADFRLTIRDNGIGIPADLGLQGQTSLGLTLMHGLTEDIRGRLTIGNDNGTIITLTFTVPESGPVHT